MPTKDPGPKTTETAESAVLPLSPSTEPTPVEPKKEDGWKEEFPEAQKQQASRDEYQQGAQARKEEAVKAAEADQERKGEVEDAAAEGGALQDEGDKPEPKPDPKLPKPPGPEGAA